MNIKFYAIKNLTNKSLAKIYCYVRKRKETLIIPTDIVVFAKYWDKKQQLAKIGTTNAVLINRKINKIRETIEAAILEETTSNLQISTTELFAKVKERFEQNQNKTIIELMDEYVNSNVKRFAPSYIKKLTTTINYVKEFKPNLNIFDLNKKFIDDFSNFLISKNLTNSSIEKTFEIIKTAVKWNFGRNIQPFDLSYFKFKGGGNDTTFALTLEEIKTLANIKAKSTAEQLDLDAFIFACFTGLRFSDVKNFHKSTINGDFIELVQQKTKQKNLIYLLPPAKQIIDKYQNDKPFINLHDQLTNRRLKDIAARAGLNRLINLTTYIGNERREETHPLHELISFHTARRSFATIMTAANLNPDLIKAMTGHRTHKEFEKYIKFDNEQLKQVANNINIMFN